MDISKVELNTDFGADLIRITDMEGRQYWYYQNDKGMLILGQPYAVVHKDYDITLFLPIPAEFMFPYVIRVRLIR